MVRTTCFASGDSVYIGSLDDGTTRLVTTTPDPVLLHLVARWEAACIRVEQLAYLAPLTFGNIAPK